jgi:malonate-semialdehyde dehydrogenase (acetylating)/methylmalonate-semialdehyde dehydrogenase
MCNPSTGQAIHKVPLASRETIQCDRLGQGGVPGMAQHPAGQACPGDVPLQAIAGAERSAISQLISEEHGKTLEDGRRTEARYRERRVRLRRPEILKGEYSRNVGPNIDAWSDFQPLGVVAGITRSTSRRWCRCGCIRWRSSAVTASSSNRPSVTRARRC